jgi:alpha,alpha-trehalase
MYGVGGERELPERTLDHLTGYEGSRPVRVGNAAYRQRQHDVWGALLDSIYLHTKSRDGVAESTWRIARRQVDEAIAHWREPDRGIWEVRGEPRHFTSSKVMCWVACDRADGVDDRGVFTHARDPRRRRAQPAAAAGGDGGVTRP